VPTCLAQRTDALPEAMATIHVTGY